ncbi:AhpC/TSA family protein [Scytonema tolypothrichoides VB-61278]|nr:AhpC/TSA family protein [Scytonema tolypothrichoides VB-61278]
MNLAQELTNLRIQAQTHLSADKLTAINQATEELRQSGIVNRSLKVGDRVENFALPNAVGNTIELKQLLAIGAVVTSFYRGTWCRFCNQELRALQEVLPEIQAQSASLIAISPQTPDNSLLTSQNNSLTFEVLSDVGNHVAHKFGIVYQLPESMRSVLQDFGVDLPAYNGNKTFELPIPATYVIAPNGKVAYAKVEPDFTKRLEPTEIVTALQTLRY